MTTSTTEPTTPSTQEEVADLSGPFSNLTLSKNQLKNEAKKKAKLEKFQAKQAKQQLQQPSASSTKSKKPLTSTSINPDVVFATMDSKLQHPMPTSYDPSFVEQGWNEWWEQNNCFQPRPYDPDTPSTPENTFVVPIPPPNVTGSLHLGHALTISIQDALVRYHRMLGKTVLYNPGCDHAGIATQSVVEKRLWKEKKQTRYDLGREQFLEKVWEWKTTHGDRIYTQLKKLGSSFDWSRARFTMDPMLSNAVTEAFLQLHAKGLIYRATKLVNWCSYLTTALSNLEVDNKEVSGPTPINVPGYKQPVIVGQFYYFAYPLESDPTKEIIVATTRLETMLGDVAIAVHPEDPRYASFIGQSVLHPFFDQRKLPIVADPFVDPNVGTGAVKITPAHDVNDYEVGQRHKLPFINILNDDGTLNQHGGPFTGLPRFEARERMVQALKEKGLFRDLKPHAMVVPICSRSGDIIEPRLKPQWYVKCDTMAQRAMEVVTKGQLSILPKASEKEWFHWLSNIQDWCISRQLWWGHRIPAYFVHLDKVTDQDRTDPSFWIVARSTQDADRLAKERFPNASFSLEQDEDVLDTWFSSGLWPFSIFGWPDATLDFQRFYPTSLLETGWDILFFWVARMVMLGVTLTDQVPFSQVFCHAMVRDAHGRKMSKSLGNVIDPMDVIQGISLATLHERLEQGNLDPKEIEKAKKAQSKDFPKGIGECGADALRFALCAYTSTGRDINLDILRVEGYRKFCNKVWQATRFCMRQLSQAEFVHSSALGWNPNEPESLNTFFESHKDTLSIPERWILGKLNKTIGQVHTHLAGYQFMAATTALHQFWIYDVCDVFLEVCKDPHFQTSYATTWPSTLFVCFDHGLKLLHPFMPFVTEELWQRLPRNSSTPTSFLILAPYPKELTAWHPKESSMLWMDLFLDVVKKTRSVMTESSVSRVYLYSADLAFRSFLTDYVTTYQSLIKSTTIPVTVLSEPQFSDFLLHTCTLGDLSCTLAMDVTPEA